MLEWISVGLDHTESIFCLVFPGLTAHDEWFFFIRRRWTRFRSGWVIRGPVTTGVLLGFYRNFIELNGPSQFPSLPVGPEMASRCRKTITDTVGQKKKSRKFRPIMPWLPFNWRLTAEMETSSRRSERAHAPSVVTINKWALKNCEKTTCSNAPKTGLTSEIWHANNSALTHFILRRFFFKNTSQLLPSFQLVLQFDFSELDLIQLGRLRTFLEGGLIRSFRAVPDLATFWTGLLPDFFDDGFFCLRPQQTQISSGPHHR